ncbi:uncharacterized protein LOC106171353 [Lingula anatina]|uniref:Uncharacterized protein LOC106171353 n=1 Tax=Lingula anatina TaxID=7574 RepID=A0A1S3J9N9_LINAN|nr:uncharacterized protein LOC106171353 [Lingula anatina]XP_013407118.1 uncharacterized protein LOC106171353 [Lingula anatina]XP_013407119.1 uncharacterized protein LOC106171353 [Lingula anatina]|eukprot:XP_013407117.1 uncharacterized protein LOC106171353 [Lingula anatina]
MRRVSMLLVISFLAAVVWAADYADDNQHPCARECKHGDTPMICEYDFTVEWYYVLSKACQDCPLNQTDCDSPECIAADGVQRAITVVNRRMPGPGIFVCHNDTISVTVRNKLMTSDVVTIHWHGISQRGTQYMDGVPMVTQCPIHSYSSFRYNFKAEEAGSHFWHAHSGFQRADGVVGPLVVRQPRSEDPHSNLYDLDLTEHYITVTEWLGELTINKFERHHHKHGDTMPQSMLINGKGAFKGYHNHVTNEHVFTPYAYFHVTPGKRHRFRMTSNGIVDCPIQFSIDGHNLTIIATDGYPVVPHVVESLVIISGERYDFVLHAGKDASAGNFWIRTAGLTNCAGKKARQLAVLRYHGAPEELPRGPTDYDSMLRGGKQLNPPDGNVEDDKERLSSVAQLHSVVPDDATSQKDADVTFYLVMDYNSMHSMKHGGHDSDKDEGNQMDQSNHNMNNDGQQMDHSKHQITNGQSMESGHQSSAMGDMKASQTNDTVTHGGNQSMAQGTTMTNPRVVGERKKRNAEGHTAYNSQNNNGESQPNNTSVSPPMIPQDKNKTSSAQHMGSDQDMSGNENDHNMRTRTPSGHHGMAAVNGGHSDQQPTDSRHSGHVMTAGGGTMAHSSTEKGRMANASTDHSSMNHSAMGNSGMDHSSMDHSTMGNSSMDHSAMGNSGMDHSSMDHSTMGNSGVGNSGMDHSNIGHSNMGNSAMDDSGMDHSNMVHSNMSNSGMGHHEMDSSAHHIHSPQINQITMTFPPKPLLSQFNEIPEGQFCNHTTHTNCMHGACECTYLLEVEYGQVVELVMVDLMGTKDSHHPMHLHGQPFRVMAMHKIDGPFTTDDVKQMDRKGLIKRKLKGAALKDTVAVPNGGFTIVRFHATNPGFWLFHCHILIHSESGMALVIKVGDPKKDFPPIPRNFPRCGTWNFENEEEQTTSAKCPDESASVKKIRASDGTRLNSMSTLINFAILWLLVPFIIV